MSGFGEGRLMKVTTNERFKENLVLLPLVTIEEAISRVKTYVHVVDTIGMPRAKIDK